MNECKQFRNIGRNTGYNTRFRDFRFIFRQLCSATCVCIMLSGCGNSDSAATNTANPSPARIDGAATSTPQLQVGQAFPVARRLTDFALTDQGGQAFGRERLLGHWSLFFFGFTRCPDICPPTLSQLSALRRNLQGNAAITPERVPQIVFISIDPDFDTPERMRDYLANFQSQASNHPQTDPQALLGLTGDPRQIKALAIQMGVAYQVSNAHRHHLQSNGSGDSPNATVETEEASEINAAVNHSGTVFLVDPNAAIRALFAPPLAEPALLRADLLQLLLATDE